MRNNRWDIDAIVHEVVERLRAGGVGKSGSAQVASPPTECNPSTLRLQQSLITLTTLEGKLKGVTNLIVLPTSVVTPAVRDELNQKGIKLQRETCEEANSPIRKIWIGIDIESRGENQWKAILDKPHLSMQQSSIASLIEQVAKRGASEEQGPAMIITCRAAMAACLANRHQAIRAAAVRDPLEAGEAIDSMAANVLVVHPERTGKIQIQRIVNLLEKTG